MKSLRELVEAMGLRATLGIVRERIVLSIVEKLICLKLRGTMERRDGYDVHDQGGSSAPSTSTTSQRLYVAATSTTIIAFEDIVPHMQKTMAETRKLYGERSSEIKGYGSW